MKLSEKQTKAVEKLKKIDPACDFFWDEAMDRPKFIKGRLSDASTKDAEGIAREFLAANKDLVFMQEGLQEELELSHIEKDKQGFSHVFMAQKINSIPVFEGSVQVHINRDGEVIAYKDNRITRVDVSTSPQVEKQDAVKICLNNLGRDTGQIQINAREAFFRDKDKGLHLAWEIECLDAGELGGFYYFIDALTGQVLFKFTQIRQALSRKTYSAQNTEILKKVLLLQDDQASSDEVAQAAHENIATVYQYYFDTFGRDSYDDKGAPLVSTVHYKENYNNAFWSDWQKQMVYGDGDGFNWKPLALALDIVGHELTHAVTASTARFLYAEEAGALDESFADIFGVFITNDDPIVDWTMGEGVYTPFKAGDALRDLVDPSKYGQPAHMDDFIHLAPGELPDPDKNDNGYVHSNSGIPNKVAHLIVAGGSFHGISVEGIGRSKAEQIYYLALTVYLSSSTRSRWTFQQARFAMLNACRQLYGDSGPEYATVKNAWAAVGVGEPADDFTVVRKAISPNLPIPDMNTAGIQSPLLVSEQGLLQDIKVKINIAHPYIGDLRVAIVSPRGDRIVLHDREGRSDDDIIETYDLTSTTGLMTFIGDDMQGEWILEVADHAWADTGTLVSWELILTTKNAQKQTVTKEVAERLIIPDDDPAGVDSAVHVDQSGKIVNLDIMVDITHTWIGDLRVILCLPSGQEYVLHDRTGGSRHDIKKTYSTKVDAALQTLINQEIHGEWKLKVIDNAGEDEGSLNSWSFVALYE